jgi:hypothetical protein
MVTAKFKVSRVSPLGGGENVEPWATEVEMTPDYAQGANKEWAEATPAGMCRLTITNKAALELLPLGEELTIYFARDGEQP